MKLICIRCPRGCEITVDGENITGNMCPRGAEYAKEEQVCPRRTVTALAKTCNGIVPVKTDNTVSKTEINNVLNEISKLKLGEVKIGDIAIKDCLGLGVNVIVTGEAYKAD